MEYEITTHYAEGRQVSFVRSAVVGWWRYIHDIDPHDAGMLMWSEKERRYGSVSVLLMLGLVRLEPDILLKFKPKYDGTLAAVTSLVQDYYKFEFVRMRHETAR